MTISKDEQTKLKDLEFMMGRSRGRLAFVVDLLSNAIVQCSCYNNTELTRLLNESKQLIQNVLHELKGKK